jgi:hypothetical protein
VKCAVPEISLPPRILMNQVLTKWPEIGLPPLAPRKRLLHLLASHTEAGQVNKE